MNQPFGPLSDLFYRGDYRLILDLTVDSASGKVDPKDCMFVVASLSFQGRSEEALAFFASTSPKLTSDQQFFCRFFLGINLTRNSNLDIGLKLIVENLQKGRQQKSAINRFFAFQGAAFHRLSQCRYKSAAKFGGYARIAALEANFIYGKVLATDLISHAQAGLGEIRMAAHGFRQALHFSTYLGNGGLSQAIRVSMLVHSAQHGLDARCDVQNLIQCGSDLTNEDNYSCARVYLELGRQYILRGDLDNAQQTLDDACAFVYASQNPRLKLLLNLRYAFLMKSRGEYHPAYNLICSTLDLRSSTIDSNIICALDGLKKSLSLDEFAIANQSIPSHFINKRIESRLQTESPKTQLIGNDPLGDLIDLSNSKDDQVGLSRLIESGYWQLVANKLRLDPCSSGIVLDIQSHSILLFERGTIKYSESGLTSIMRSLLFRLQDGERSKEYLIEEIWNYKYSSVKHDRLVYSALNRLRSILGSYAHWIETSENGYRLKHKLFLRSANPVESPVDQPSLRLNNRQTESLQMPWPEDFFRTSDYQKYFEISSAAARRDIAELVKIGKLQKTGEGPSTHYSVPNT